MRGIAHTLLVACILTQLSCRFAGDPVTYDGFEAATLSNIWDTEKHIPGAVEIQSEIFRNGKSAAKIILHPGDQIDEEKGTILERAELMQVKRFWAREDLTYEYSFSLLLPEGFPIVPTRLVIAQWKQRCPSDNCYPDNPTLAVRYIADELLITHKVTSEEDLLYRLKEDIRGKWLDFRFQLRFSKQKGVVKVWLNDKMIVDYQGSNAYPVIGGYPDRNRFYFKFGLYRDESPEIMTLYIDEFRMKQLSGP